MHDDYINLLIEFSAFPRTTQNSTIFEVAGFPHYENVISNILAFYLNPQREHGMGSLLLDSILKVAGEEVAERIPEIEVERECPTDGGGRLDLVVKTSSYVIGIENKIFAPLYNNLLDYRATIEKSAAKRRSIGIVLSLRKIPLLDNCGFKNITYAKLWHEVKSQLGHRIQKSDTKWLQYLFDLMNTTKTLENADIDLTPEDEFFIKNDQKIKQLVEERDKFRFKLERRLEILKEMIKESDRLPRDAKQWIWQKECLVHEFTIDGHNVTFDLWISTEGWKLQILTKDTNKESKKNLENLLKDRRHEVMVDNNDEPRFNIKEWQLDASLEDIQKYLCDWMEWLPKQKQTVNRL